MNFKRLVCMLLVVAMLGAYLPAYATAETETISISAGDYLTDLDVPQGKIGQKFTFIPEETGTYAFVGYVGSVTELEIYVYDGETESAHVYNALESAYGQTACVFQAEAGHTYTIITLVGFLLGGETYNMSVRLEKAVEPEGISISNSEMDLSPDQEKDLEYRWEPLWSIPEDVQWFSEDPSVATVDQNGHVIAVGNGTTYIGIVSESGLSNYCQVRVSTPESVSFAYENKTGYVGKADILDIEFTPYGSEEDFTVVSDNPAVAEVKDDGNCWTVTYKELGIANLTVTTASGLTDTCTVTVKQMDTIALGESRDVTVHAGDMVRFLFTAEETADYSFCTEDKTGYFSADNLGYYNTGCFIHYVEAGSSCEFIIWNDGSSDMTYPIRLEKAVPVDRVELSMDGSGTYYPGSTFYLDAQTYPAWAYYEDWTWTTSDESVASLSGSGRYRNVTCHKAGTAVITVTMENGATDTFTVYVKDLDSIDVGESVTFTLQSGGEGKVNFTPEKTGPYVVYMPNGESHWNPDTEIGYDESFFLSILQDGNTISRRINNTNYQVAVADLEAGTTYTLLARHSWATDNPITGSISIDELVHPQSITIDAEDMKMETGDWKNFACYTDGSLPFIPGEITWSVDDPSVIVIDYFNSNQAGISAVGLGTATLTVTYETGISDSVQIRVVNDIDAPEYFAEGSFSSGAVWHLDENGVLTLEGNGTTDDYSSGSAAPWADYRDQIVRVDVMDGITAIGNNCFDGCSNLTEIYFLGNAPEIANDAFSGVEAHAYYCFGNDTWIDADKDNYGGNISWLAAMTLWVPDADLSWAQAQIQAFAAANPQWDIAWILNSCSEGEAYSKVSNASVKPDVYFFANDQLETLRNSGLLLKLDHAVAEQVSALNSQNYLNSLSDAQGNLYGVPMSGNTWLMYYNKEVFTEEDVKSLETMLEKGKVAFGVSNSWYLPAFYFANGCTMFGTDSKEAASGVDFGGEKGTEATKRLVELLQNSNFLVDADGVGNQGLRDGTIGAYFSGSWDYRNLHNELGNDLGAAQLPTVVINGETRQLKSYYGSVGVGVNPESSHKEAAQALAAFLGSVQAQKDRFLANGTVPTVFALKSDEDIQKNVAAVAQMNTIDNTAVMQPVISEMGQCWGPLGNMGSALANGQVTMENAAELTEEMNISMNGGAGILGQGKCGDELYWKVTSNNELIIYGEGDMYDYLFREWAPWRQQGLSVSKITIGNRVTGIGDYAFALSGITEIHIPASVTSIGEGVFLNTTSLRQISVDPANESYMVVDDALVSADGTTLLAHPTALRKSSYAIPEGIVKIGAFAFCNSWIVNLTFPDSVQVLDKYSCYNMMMLQNLVLGNGITTIDENAFYYCFFKTVSIGPNVSWISDSAFQECVMLEEISVDEDNPYYKAKDGVLYNADESLLHTVPGRKIINAFVVPETVSRIGDYAFYMNAYTSNVYFTGNAPTIGENGFKDTELVISYPAADSTWNDVANNSYGGTLHWYPDNTELTVVVQPESTRTIANNYAVFTCMAAGDRVSYQWQCKGPESPEWMEFDSDRDFFFQVNASEYTDNWQYRCKVTDAIGNVVYSDIATLTVHFPKLENSLNNDYQISDLIRGEDGIYRTPENQIVYIAVNNVDDGGIQYWLNGETLHYYVDMYAASYFDLTYWPDLLNLMDDQGYVVLTDDSLRYLTVLVTGNPAWGETEENVKEYLFYDREAAVEEEKLVLDLWTYPVGKWGDSATVDSIIGEFESQNPGVEIRVTYLDYMNGDNQVRTAIESGNAPDLILEGPERLVAEWGNSGLMVDLSDLLDDEDISQIIPNALAACYGSDGGLYQYPFCGTVHTMAINKNIFEAAGAMQYIDEETHTWTTSGSNEASDFFKAVQAVYEYTGSTVGKIYCSSLGGDQGIRALINNIYNGTFTNAQHTAYTWYTPRNVVAIRELLAAEGLEFDTQMDGGNEISDFVNGDLAVAFCWNVTQQIMNNGVTASGDEIMYMAFPTNGEPGFEIPQLCGGIWGMGIFDNGNGEEIAAAKDFVKFVCDSEATADAVEASGYFAVRDTADGTDLTGIWESDSIMNGYSKMMPMLGDYYVVAPNWSGARRAWNSMLKDIAGGRDPQDAAGYWCAIANGKEDGLETFAEGVCGDNAVWHLATNGVLTISGSGDMYDYENYGNQTNHAPWDEDDMNLSTIKAVVEEGITHLSNGFLDGSMVKSVSLPAGLKTIGESAFLACQNLEEINIPEGVTTIGQGAFMWCSSLTEIKLPSTMKRLMDAAFWSCTALSKFELNEGLEYMAGGSMLGLPITEIIIPSTVTVFDYPFYVENTDYFSKITFTGNAPEFSENAFSTLVSDVYYPADNETWTQDILQQYGGTVNWIPYTKYAVSQGEEAVVEPEQEATVKVEAEITEFVQVMIDGQVVDPENYTLTEGSTIITFKPEFLATLGEGTYNVTMEFETGLAFATITLVDEPLPEYSITYTQASISLAGDIGLNYYATLSEDLMADEGAYMIFTVAGEEQIVPISEAIISTGKNGELVYRFSCAVPARMMSEQVVGQMYASDGTAVGEAKAFSVKAYCDKAIAAYGSYASYANLVNLMKAMLNYGGYSQIKFGYNTGNLANADLEDKSLPNITAADLAGFAHGKEGAEAGINIQSVSLLLESTTTIRFYFKLDGSKPIESYTFVVDGEVVEPVHYSGTTYYVDKVGVPARELDVNSYVEVGGLRVWYCGMSYVRQILNSSTDTALINACKALYAYSEAANAYFK